MKIESLKAIDFSEFGGIDGFLETVYAGDARQAIRLRQSVAWINRAVSMTANAIAQIPYQVMQGEATLAERVAWGGVRNPRSLIYKFAASLCSGAAYALIDVSPRAIVSIDYVAPYTMRPKYNSAGALIGFERTANGKVAQIPVENALYMFYPDETVEGVAPANIYPIKNALLAAGIMAAADSAIRSYGERGFIPPTLLAVKGNPTPAEKEKAETWWNRFLRGWTNTVAKILNAEAVEIKTVGAGINELRGSYTEIVTQQIKNIAAAFSIPAALFLSDAANYATMGGERRTWYETGVITSIYQTIEDELNRQIFFRFGRTFKFIPEALPVFQDDENEKANSLTALASAFAANPSAALIAADILGYALSPEQIARIKSLNRGEDVMTASTPPPPLPRQDEVEAEKSANIFGNGENEIAAELKTWREWELKRFGKKSTREFTVNKIPPALAALIKSRLLDAGTPADVAAVFDGAGAELPLIRLARVIEEAINEPRGN